MAANLSENFFLPVTEAQHLDETDSLSSPSSKSSEPAHFGDHTLTTDNSPKSRKRDFSHIVSPDLTRAPDELKERKITPVEEHTWNPDEEKVIHDETTDEDHFLSDTESESPEELETAALEEEDLFKDWESIPHQQETSASTTHATAPHPLKLASQDELSGSTR